MKFFLFRPFIFFVICLSMSTASVSADTSPDVYDQVFRDDLSSTTVNFIEVATIQTHTLDSPEDEDRAIFLVANPGFFYTFTVSVPATNSNIDPTILILDDTGTTITRDAFSGDPGVYDSHSLGMGETTSYQLTGNRYYVRIAHSKSAGVWGDDAQYFLQITGGPGDTVGLGTISSVCVGPGGGIVSSAARAAIKVNNQTKNNSTSGIYSERRIVFSGPPTPSLSSDQWITFGHTLDANDPVKSVEPTREWLSRAATQNNYSIVMLHIGNEPYGLSGIRSFSSPATLTLQLRLTSTILSNGILVNDVPAGFSTDAARVMVCNPALHAWCSFSQTRTLCREHFCEQCSRFGVGIGIGIGMAIGILWPSRTRYRYRPRRRRL